MTWKLYNRNGEWLGDYAKPEVGMSVLGTGDIGIRWMPLSETEFIGFSDGGAARFVLRKDKGSEQ